MKEFDHSNELIFGLVGAVGVELKRVQECLIEQLDKFNFRSKVIKVSRDIIRKYALTTNIDNSSEYDRLNHYMTEGNNLRKSMGANDFMAMAAIANIHYVHSERLEDTSESSQFLGKATPADRHAFIIDSLKRPEEVSLLRKVYGDSFYLISAYSNPDSRRNHLIREKGMDENQAIRAMKRDEEENVDFGQRTRDTFHLADVFLHLTDDISSSREQVLRFLNVIFGDPHSTPSFDEYAMYMAFAASLRSSDLSRQVGAVISTATQELLATGANDVPSAGGGLYWTSDDKKGRDVARGYDSNERERSNIIDDIVKEFPDDLGGQVEEVLKKSKLRYLTEYGRAVHAEMEAILSAARIGVSIRNSHLYCTTFPCHNCAKHIIAAGIMRVVYIEPYPKSKTMEFHDDSIVIGLTEEEEDSKVHFEPFVGIGPRRFFDLFSMRLSSGREIKRKIEGKALPFDPRSATVRVASLPTSYLERERIVTHLLADLIEDE